MSSIEQALAATNKDVIEVVVTQHGVSKENRMCPKGKNGSKTTD